jgi:hypothetical protein
MTSLTQASRMFIARRQRAASLRQVWSQRVGRFASLAWAVLEAAGQRRAAPYLLYEASRHEQSDPALAAELRRLALDASTPARTPTLARAD